ncbi:YadA-like family protein [Veillonella sp. VA142]|uniref:YadA-like family protein n=1 Tax=Veillonella sp. VA142 TaxID=741834 RepID=UPI0013DEE3BF|nr:YadA-like family protein [Veillonella sp. VA142]
MKKQKVAVYVASMLVLGSHAVGYADGDTHPYVLDGGQVSGTDTHAIAIGSTSSVNGESAVAIGDASKVEANQAVAIGKDSKATVDGGVALGVDSIADRAGNRSSNIGYNPMSNAQYKVGEAGADNPKLEALYEAIRQANYKVLLAEEEIERANASHNATVIATANTQKAKADQDLVDAKNAYTAAIEEANKAGNDAISSAWNASDGAVSVGGTKDGKQHTRQIINVAAGYEDTDAATVGQLRVVRNRLEREKPRYISIKSRDLGVDSNENNNGATQEGAIAIGPRAKSESENAIAIGRNVQIGQNSKNTVAVGIGINKTGTRSVNIGEGTITSGENSTAVGQGAKAGDSALAIGGSAKAESKNSVAVGRTATVGTTALGATALGDSANSDESQSISVGYSAHAYQFGSIAVGAQTETHGNGSIAIGHNSKVGESDTPAYAGISIGMDAKTVVRTGVALGTGSYADRAVNSTSNRGYDPSLHGPHFADATAEAAVERLERSKWKATDSAVSVGDSRTGYHKTRQIINVAAGGEDTDAVNVAQLKALEKRNTILAGNDVPFKADGTVSDATPDTRVYTPGDKEIKIQGKANTVYGVAPQAGAKAPDGKSEYAAPTLYSSDNLITYKDPTDSILRIGLLNTPTFTGVNFANPTMNITLGGNDKGQLTLTTGGKGDGATSTTSPVLTVASLKDVLKAESGIKITEKDGGEYGKTYTLSLNKTELKGDPDFKGDKGDKGDQGIQGEKGDTGATGAKGEKGETGATGPKGENGKSAYEVWKTQEGHAGKSEAEYLASLKGDKGETGATGAKGEKGETGAAGSKGDKGDTGTAGKDGSVGKSAYEYWKEIKGNENKTEDDFRKALEGGTKINTLEHEKLERQIGELGNDLQELRKESRNGDALGAALSALKPIQYDPLEPTQFMAGIGHYKNVNAVAIGIAHYTKESTMLHAGISMVRGATMINGGATFKFGNSPEKKAIPERYRNGPISSVLVLHDEMVAMKEAYGREITVLTQENNNLRQDIAVLQQEMQELRAMVHK